MIRRANGTGSVITRADGRLVLCKEAGWTTKGTRAFRRQVTPRGTTRKEADRLLLRFLRDETPTEGAATNATVKSYADDWLPRVAGRLKPNAYAVTSAAVRHWVVPTIGRKRLDQLTPGDIRAVVRAILTADLAPSTANRYQGVLARMLKDARLDGHRVPHVLDDVEGTPAGESGRDAIPLPDAVAILATAGRRPDKARWAAALLQGMRPAEVLGLTWDRVDLEAGTLDVSWQLQPLPYRITRDRTSGFRVPVGYTARHLVGAYHLTRPKTKSGQRVIPMVPWLVDSLRTWREKAPENPYGLVWAHKGQPVGAKADRAAWAALVRSALGGDADVPDLYAARHTTATMLQEAGVAPEVIIQIVGHSTYASTHAYVHVRQAPLREALAAVADRFGLGSLELTSSE